MHYGEQDMVDAIRIDDLDRQILELLHVDARMPSSRIAERLHVTDRTVRNRIDKLLQSGLARFGLLINQEAAGYPVVGIVHVEVESGRLDQVARKLAGDDSVSHVATCIAAWDLTAQIYARSNEEMHEWVNHTFAGIEGVRRVRTSIHPRIYKRPADWLPASLRRSQGERSERPEHTVADEMTGPSPTTVAAD